MCMKHYTRWLRHGDPEHTMRPDWRVHGVCVTDGCERAPVAHGLCDTCRMRARRGSAPRRPARVWCGIRGCDNGGQIVGGLCPMHYARLKRNGSPFVTNHPLRGDPEARRVKALGASASWRAKLRAVDDGFDQADWLASIDEWGGCCAYCGRDDLPLTRDHVQPLSRGGRHAVDNIVPACKPCNSAKRDRTADEFLSLTSTGVV